MPEYPMVEMAAAWFRKLKEFIETKGRETNYNESRAECGRLMDELNTLVIANADKALSTRTQISGY